MGLFQPVDTASHRPKLALGWAGLALEPGADTEGGVQKSGEAALMGTSARRESSIAPDS